jgi:hypothetical protein
MAFLNAYACAGKEANAKVTGTDDLPVRVNLKNVDRSNAAKTDRSIWSVVFLCTLDYQLQHQLLEHGRE